MKNKNNYLGLKLSVIGLCLIFVISCKKDDVDSFTDSRDGNVYKTVKIGNQVWMAENLRYLPSVSSPETESRTTPYYYVNRYNGTNVSEAKATAIYSNYGVLYNWPAACSSCPAGWHLPTVEEWSELIEYLSGNDIAGGKLKEKGTTHWESPNEGATNKSGFTALPGGSSAYDETVGDIGCGGGWWSASDVISEAWFMCMYYNYSKVDLSFRNKVCGFSVRCVKD